MEYKQNYINNHDLLAEIHKSKTSYCTFTNPEYHQYDIIVNSIEDITEEVIEHAKKNRASRLSNKMYVEKKLMGTPVKLSECEHLFDDIPTSDLIFRIMTNDHVPVQLSKKKSTKLQSKFQDDDIETDLEIKKLVEEPTADKMKINFPPFQHWKFNEDNVLCCVGKSHWRGDIEHGCFDQTKGNITTKLASMMMILAERYATKGNLRSYTYNDEMRGQAVIHLIEFGLKFNEARSENAFSYLSQIVKNAMIRVLNIEERHRNIRDDLLEINGLNPSYTRMNDNDGSSYHD